MATYPNAIQSQPVARSPTWPNPWPRLGRWDARRLQVRRAGPCCGSPIPDNLGQPLFRS